MLYLLDTNVLVYAKMKGMPEHPKVSRWLADTVADPVSEILVCETSILAFLRISTNTKIFDPPLDLDDARDYLSDFLSIGTISIFRPTAHHFFDVADLGLNHDMTGRHIMDAHLAAIALGTGATLVTRDKDFKRIPYLKILDPLNA
jgi:toxin-antitoxin system PIN domain toxin